MTATFSNSQTETPSLGSNFNGTVSSISGSGTIFTFTWIPTTTSATSFNFINVLGYTGTLTSTNQITPLEGTTVSVSGTAYDNVDNIITSTFNNSQTETPTLNTCLNGTVSNISGSGTIFTFTWNPTTILATSFNFDGVLGYTGTLTSSNQLTPIAGTTVSVSGTAYDNVDNTITATFSNTQSSTPTLDTCLNGTVSNISGSGTTFTFIWNPTTTSPTSFNFDEVLGYTGTLTSTNQLTPLAGTTVSVSITGNAYDSVNNIITAVFSNTQTATPTLDTCLNGTVSNISGSGTTYTFTWNPNNTSSTSFNFDGVTGYTGTLTSANQLTPIAGTTVSVSITGLGNAYDGVGNTITATFSNSQITTPSLGTCANGTVSSISGSGTTFTFTWTPSSISATSFNFTSVTGYTGTLTSSNQLTPLAGTTVSVSILTTGNAYDNIGNTMTATFSNSQITTPSLGSNSNGTVSSISGSGTIFTFTWIPTTTSATSFNFINVLGYTGTLTSTNQITPLEGTTVSVSGTAYDNVDNIITATFNNSQTGTPTLDTCLNGTVSNISGSGTIFTFTWNPTNTSLTSFNFDGVLGYTGTLTSSNQLTPLAGTTVSVSGTSYDNVDNTMTAVFSNTQTGTPTLDTCLNGTVSNITGSGTIYTFTWNPNNTSSTSFNFDGVLGYTGTLTSTNQLTPLAGTTVSVSILTTGNAYDGVNNTITATFSNTQSSIPTLDTCLNGTVSNISGSGTTYTFTWNPSDTSSTSFNFDGVTGYTGTLTSTNQLTPIAGTTVSVFIIGNTYDGVGNTITATFSNSQITTPSLGTCANGTVSGISGSGTTFTFTWTPSSISATSFNFTNVLGYAGTLTSTNQLTPLAGTTVSVSILTAGNAYDNIGNTMTATFSNSQITTPSLGSNSNGTVSSISGSGTTFTFIWTPTTTSATSFNFTNVLGYTGTLTSTNNITPLAGTTVSVSGTAYDNVNNIITATFNNSQTERQL